MSTSSGVFDEDANTRRDGTQAGFSSGPDQKMY